MYSAQYAWRQVYCMCASRPESRPNHSPRLLHVLRTGRRVRMGECLKVLLHVEGLGGLGDGDHVPLQAPAQQHLTAVHA